MTMNNRECLRRLILLMIACIILPLLLAACQPVGASTGSAPETPVPVEPAASPTPTPPPASKTGVVTLEASGLFEGLNVELVLGTPAGAGAPWWEVAPQHQRATLLGYPVAASKAQAQIFVYPAAEMAASGKAAAQAVAGLQELLQSRQPGEALPYLPLSNDRQALHARVAFLDFHNGSGVAYLTQLNQGPVKINNTGLVYTFQGLTADGKFYLAAVLPVTHPELPAAAEVFAADLAQFPAYLAETAAWLEQQPAASFTPDLAKLDALVQSILVR